MLSAVAVCIFFPQVPFSIQLNIFLKYSVLRLLWEFKNKIKPQNTPQKGPHLLGTDEMQRGVLLKLVGFDCEKADVVPSS